MGKHSFACLFSRLPCLLTMKPKQTLASDKSVGPSCYARDTITLQGKAILFNSCISEQLQITQKPCLYIFWNLVPKVFF